MENQTDVSSQLRCVKESLRIQKFSKIKIIIIWDFKKSLIWELAKNVKWYNL